MADKIKQLSMKKLAEFFKQLNLKNSWSMWKTDSENWKNQELVPIEIDSDITEDDIRPNIRALPKFAKTLVLMRKISIRWWRVAKL